MDSMYRYIFYFMSFVYIISIENNLVWLFFSSIFTIPSIPNKNEETTEYKLEEERKSPPEIPYQDKYLDKFQKLSMNNETLNVDTLKNSIVVEHTPLGNVAMFYDSKRETFVYYSDSVMPYRYLEVVARKYVITFHCKSIFVVMEDEINKAKMKLEEQKLKKEQQEREENETNTEILVKEDEPKKKNVFATFKNYNKNTTKDSSNKPVTGSSTATTTHTKPNEDLILKENANHYTCDGRYSNFLVLKKVDKTLTDSRLKMTFADFKKMQAKKNSS